MSEVFDAWGSNDQNFCQKPKSLRFARCFDFGMVFAAGLLSNHRADAIDGLGDFLQKGFLVWDVVKSWVL